MKTTILSTKFQLLLPKAIRESVHLKPGQRFLVQASFALDRLREIDAEHLV